MIPERLKKAAQLAGRIHIGADIACDHAYLSYYLLDTNLADYMIAADIKANPLANAKRTLSRFIDRSDLRLGFGLQPLTNGEADAIFICGLGAETIVEILQDGMSRFKNTIFILQVNGDPSPLRQYLMDKPVAREEIVKEHHHYYQILVSKEGYPCGEQMWGKNAETILRIGQLYQTELGQEYLKKRINDVEKALKNLELHDPRGRNLREELRCYSQLLKSI